MYAMVHVPGGSLKTPPSPLLVPLVIMTKMTAPLMMTLTMTQRNIMSEGGIDPAAHNVPTPLLVRAIWERAYGAHAFG